MFGGNHETPAPLGTRALRRQVETDFKNAVISAETAYEKAANGELLLIDIRTQQEWCRTGVPESSHMVTMDDPIDAEGFVEAMVAEVDGRLETPVALICRTGRRTAIARAALLEGGFSRVLDVKEGVEGGSHGRGWLAHGLPVDDHCCCVAQGMDEDDCRC